MSDASLPGLKPADERTNELPEVLRAAVADGEPEGSLAIARTHDATVIAEELLDDDDDKRTSTASHRT